MLRQERRKENKNPRWTTIVSSMLKGGVAGVGAAVLILLIGAVLMSRGIIPVFWTDGLVLAACFLGSFLGCTFQTRKKENNGRMIGIGAGCTMALMLIGGRILFCEGGSLEQGSWTMLILSILGGAVSGFVRTAAPKRVRRRK